MVPHSPAAFKALKLKCLRKALFNIGSRQTGNKSQLSERLSRDLLSPKIPSKCVPSSANANTATKILSIDMGIKNLAYCVVSTSFEPVQKSQDAAKRPLLLNVSKWQRINVIDAHANSSINAD